MSVALLNSKELKEAVGSTLLSKQQGGYIRQVSILEVKVGDCELDARIGYKASSRPVRAAY